MATTNKRLCKGTLTTSNATLYTVPASTTTVVKAVTICNKTATAQAVTLKFAGTEVIYQHSLAGKDTITLPFMDQILSAGELIEGLSDANSAINYYISGKEIA